MANPIRWRAGSDQIDHAFRRGDLRTFCGLRIVPENRAWPRTIQCHECIAVAGREANRH